MRTGVTHCTIFRLRMNKDVHYKPHGKMGDCGRAPNTLWCPIDRVRDVQGMKAVTPTPAERNVLYPGYLLDDGFLEIVEMLNDQGLDWGLSRKVFYQDNPYHPGEPILSSIVNLVVSWHPETLGEASNGTLYTLWITLTLPVADEDHLSLWYKRCRAAQRVGKLSCTLCCIHLDRGYTLAGVGGITEFSVLGSYHYLTGVPLCRKTAAHWKLKPSFRPLLQWIHTNRIGLHLAFLPRDESAPIDPKAYDFEISNVHDWSYLIATWDNQSLVNAQKNGDRK